MADTPAGSDITQDLSSDNTSMIQVAEEFDSAWQQSLNGHPPPDLDLAVAKAPESARGALRKLLEEISNRYLKKSSSPVTQLNETVFSPPSSGAIDASPAGTCETINVSEPSSVDVSLPPDASVRSRLRLVTGFPAVGMDFSGGFP